MNQPIERRPHPQDAIKADISIIGVDDLTAYLCGKVVKLNKFGAKPFGAPEVSLFDYCTRDSALSGVSFERSLVSELLNMGYALEELEISFDHTQMAHWGKAVWYKDHPAYQEPIPEFKAYADSGAFIPPYFYATFKTEGAGDQKFSIYSMQMVATLHILLHKTILFHKVVLSPPKTRR